MLKVKSKWYAVPALLCAGCECATQFATCASHKLRAPPVYQNELELGETCHATCIMTKGNKNLPRNNQFPSITAYSCREIRS